MARFRPKIFFHDLLHHVILLTAIVIFLWAALLSALRFSFPLVQKHLSYFTHVLNKSFGVQLTFDQMNINWHHLQPEIFIKNTLVWNEHHQLLMQIPKATGRINIIDSLLKQQFVFSLIQFDDWQLHVYQLPDNNWRIFGMESLAPGTSSKTTEFFSRLLNIKHLQLQNAHIFIQPTHYKPIELQQLNAEWLGSGNNLKIVGNTSLTFLQNPKPIPLKFGADLNGDWFTGDNKEFTGTLYLKAPSFDVKPWVENAISDTFNLEEAYIGGELWANWQNDHWKSITTRLILQQLKIRNAKKAEKPWQWQTEHANIDLFWHRWKDGSHWSFVSNALNGSVVLGNLFHHKIAYQTWHSEGQLQQSTHQTTLILPILMFDTNDVHLNAQLRLNKIEGRPVTLRILASTHFNTLRHFSDYLPIGVMPTSLVHWLETAIVSGGPLDANFLWRGSPNHFPFDDQSGTMQVAAKVSNVELHFAPDWPAITHLNANLFFTSHDMHILATQGSLKNISINGTQAEVPAFKKDSVLNIRSHINTDLGLGWAFLVDSPLKKPLSPLLNTLTPTGPIDLNLYLHIPLNSEQKDINYQGTLTLNNDRLSLTAVPLHLEQLQGQFSFAPHQLSGALQANWLKAPWVFTIKTDQKTSHTQLTGEGILPLSAWLNEIAPYFANWLNGQSTASFHMNIPNANNDAFDLRFNSNLEGISVHSPIGIQKTANNLTPFSVEIRKTSSSPLSTIVYWKNISDIFNIEATDGAYYFDTPLGKGTILAPNEEHGLWQINAQNINLTKWQKDFSYDVKNNFQLPSFNLTLDNLFWGESKINKLILKLRPNGSQNVINYLFISRPAFTLTAHGGWNLKGTPGTTQLVGNIQTPNLADLFKLLDWPQMINTKKAELQFNAKWPGTLWEFDQKALSGDVRVTTNQGVFTDISRSTNNKINLGRVLNLLSINALSSHLKSHFSDLTERGFAFDDLSGQFSLLPRKINPINIQIDGLVANVDLAGCVNREAGTLKLVAEIKPKLTSSLPIIAAIAGGPIVGAVSFFADKLLTSTVGQIGASYYAIQGPFQDLQTKEITQLKRNELLRSCA